MKTQSCLLLWIGSSLALSAADPITFLNNWPAWRGPLGTGVAPHSNPPVEWSETNHIKWKVSVPGRGTASPVVWDDQVFILAAIPTGKKVEPKPAAEVKPVPEAKPAAELKPETRPVADVRPAGGAPDGAAGGGTNRVRRGGGGQGGPGGGGGGGGRVLVEPVTEEQRFTVISFDRKTGKILWQQSPRTLIPHEGHHKDHGFASASPVTDGEVLIASFGSRGIFAFDLKGNLLWQKDFGLMKTRGTFGEGSSPALSGDRVFVVWDHDGEGDFIVALDKRTGKELWRQSRDEDTNWSTPLVVEYQGKKQVVTSGGNKSRSYDFETGELIWEAAGQTKNAIPAPVAGHGRVYITSGWRGAALQAISLGRKGDLTGTDGIAWSHNKSTPYVPSPLLYGDWLYFYANNNAQLSIFNAKDGSQQLDAERLEGLFGVYASPVGAGEHVYLVARDGGTWVIKNGPKLEVVAKNKLDDGFDASPAIVGNTLFLRGRQSLYAIE